MKRQHAREIARFVIDGADRAKRDISLNPVEAARTLAQPPADSGWRWAGVPHPGTGLHVALVTETYPPEVNGVATTTARIVDELVRLGHGVHLFRPRQPGESALPPGGREAQAHGANPPAGLNQHRLPGLAVPRYPGLRMGLPATRRFVRLWRERRPDVVHLVTEGPLGWSALRAARHLGLPVVSDFRTNFHAYSRHYGAAWLHDPIAAYLRRFHNRTACTMVPTARLRDALAVQGYERLQVVARGVDTQRFDPARRDAGLRARWGAGPETPVAICVGRLAREKNLDTVIDAFRALRVRSANAKLVLVGDGPDRARLADRCPEAVFAGQRQGDDLAAHYASADLFLFASTTETFGNVVTEAMASGLAVLAYDHAAAGELIRDGADGLIAPLGDRATFLRLATCWADDPALARRLGRAARRRACTLDWQSIAQAVGRTYWHVISQHENRKDGQASACRPAQPPLATGSGGW